MIYKLNKMDKAKVIVTALYNLPELVTEKNKMAWKHAQKISRNWKMEYLDEFHKKAVDILSNRPESPNK